MTEIDDVPTRVARGVSLLDQHKPGWAGLIDLSSFDISCCDRCVLGQIYHVRDEGVWGSGFGRGADELGIANNEGEYGFDNLYADPDTYLKDEFPALQREWVRVIEVLRQKQVTVTEDSEVELSTVVPVPVGSAE
jgi:hypothetical protein